MITNPYDHQHPLFPDQRSYVLERAVLDTGDDLVEATAVLSFRHASTGRRRTFRFSGVRFTTHCGEIFDSSHGYLPVYVATLAGRGWEGEVQIEIGILDPGGVCFWAETIEEME